MWSYGVVIYEVLTRKAPYQGEDSTLAALGIMEGTLSLVPEIEEQASQYPPVLVDLLKLCLQHDPAQRPAFREIVKTFEDMS